MRANGCESADAIKWKKRTRCHSNGCGSHLGCERGPSVAAMLLASHRHSPAAAAIVKFCDVTEISEPELPQSRQMLFVLVRRLLPGHSAAAATFAAAGKRVRLRCARTPTSSGMWMDGNRDSGSGSAAAVSRWIFFTGPPEETRLWTTAVTDLADGYFTHSCTSLFRLFNLLFVCN
ncbi:uncharacterized protein LOC115764851 isoform X5 [Drosophila novamexicana]|uniref:uncharacterized protein LOC115764851 isoform X5 n=1 Tax=Drosophila novamexicana TaxID=47314 RepID=UPI0011E5AAE0|nr:uncharacterized protein LOC115764851 isoform X5 [Drosophila novamexicana]